MFIGVLICLNIFSQKGEISIGVGPSLGFPIGNKNFTYYYKTGIGGTVQANFGMTKFGSIITAVTVVSIGAKNLPVAKTSLTLIKAGYKTGFSNSSFFAATDAGLAFYGGGKKHLAIGGAIGYTFKLSKSSSIDVFPAYNVVLGTASNSMWLTANVLYRFSLKKRN